MVKKVTASAAKVGSNGYDGEKLEKYIKTIEGHFDEMETAKGQHMNRCRKIRQSIDVVYTEAKGLGISRKALKAHVDLRLLEKRKAALVEKLSDDDAESFEAMADALGDFATLPLGMAALQVQERRAEEADENRAALGKLN